MGRTSLEIILKYVPEDPARFHTQEYVDEQIKRIERTLEAPQEPSGGPPSGVLGRSPAPVA